MSVEPIPLKRVDSAVLLKLGAALWDWQLCTGCANSKACQSEACPSSRSDKLQRYLQFYRAIVTAYVGESSTSSRLLNTHDDLFKCVSRLKSNPGATHTEFHCLCFPVGQGATPHDAAELRNATSLVVKVMVMIESSALHHESSGRLEKVSFRTPWRDNIAFSTYLQDLFPTTNHHVLSYVDSELFLDMKSELRATKLKKHLGVSFRPTHDIRSHLLFDREANVIEIFHYTAFLKEQLRATKSGGDFSTASSSINVGSLPRQLVLEVLDSIQTVLFPLSEPKSKRLLQSLVDKCSLDPDIVNFEYSSIRNIGEENIPYVYLADRLSDLYNEVRNPRPRGWLERQIERKSGARYMMMATLIGVMFAVLLGIVSLAVSSFQTWIAYQAWKYPVMAPS